MLKPIIFLVIVASSLSNGCKNNDVNKDAVAAVETEKAVVVPQSIPPQKKQAPRKGPKKSSNPSQIFKEYVTPYPLNNLKLENADSNYGKALAAYQNENWQEAFDLFYKMNPKTDQTLMYEASCKIQQTYYLHAKQILLTLMNVARGKTKEHVEWNMALVELAMGEKPLDQLQRIRSNPQHLFATQASEILTRISD